MKKQSSGLVTLGQKSVDANHQYNSMSWTAYYENICQMYQSDKEDSEWYSKSLRKDLHETQVKRHAESLYSKSDSEESYKVIKLSFIKKEPLWDKLDYTQ